MEGVDSEKTCRNDKNLMLQVLWIRGSPVDKERYGLMVKHYLWDQAEAPFYYRSRRPATHTHSYTKGYHQIDHKT